MGTKTKPAKSGSRALLHDIATTLNELVVREHQVLQDELKQLSKLIKDAISTLDRSFRQINDSATEQTKLASSITDIFKQADRSIPVEINELNKISEKIDKNVAAAIRSLQFEDIIQQLAAHSSNRASQIEQLFKKLGENLVKLKDVDENDTARIEQVIQAMQSDMEDFRRAVEKDNPVKQASMGEGKIELF